MGPIRIALFYEKLQRTSKNDATTRLPMLAVNYKRVLNFQILKVASSTFDKYNIENRDGKKPRTIPFRM